MPKKFRRMAHWLLFAAAAAAFLLWQNNSLCVEEFSFTSARLPDGWHGGRIAVISDLHGKSFGKDNRRLVRALERAQPDVIAITGDLCDERSGLDFVPPLLDALTDLAPTCYVTGNHEWAAGVMPQLRKLLEAHGVIYLRNSTWCLPRGGAQIVLAGVDDPNGYADQPTPQEVAEQVAQDAFWILLAHRNKEYPTYGTLGADLVISGHAHGGLVRLPFTDGLFGPGAEWMPRWTSGFYTTYPTPLFVSRGLGNSVCLPRIGNRPQLAVINLFTE